MSMVEIAEHNGFINDVGGWVLERACRDHVGWMQRHPGISLDLAVNISALQLMTPGFTATVARILADTGVAPATLILEMTETIFLADGDRATTVLSDLKAMNVQLALDDFGTGYSSLSYLRAFPVDMIKIDRSFTAELGEEPGSSAMISSLIQLAHVIGLTVTIEGVETQAQRDEVRAMAPEAAQGYFFSRPAPADTITALLAQPSLPAPADA
jgi:EAL domain-containing protein (putative c-di-GMP-specific phosphodiesterase class I)